MEYPHAEVERPQPIPHASQTGSHADRRDRDEPFELARCGDCAWRRAPAVEEARGRREHLAEAAHSLARGSEEVRTQHRTHSGRLRGRRALAQGARHRGPHHPRIERSRIARAPARQDRSSRHRVAQTRLSRLVAGERDHCRMVAIPTIKDEDAKRPNRERESLVGEQSRIVNRMKAALVRLGIRGFNPKLKKAVEHLDGLRTPEGEPIPPNTLAELRRDMARRRLVNDQIRQIEDTRLERLEQAPSDGPHAMVRLLARVIGLGIETADMLVQEVLSRNMRDRRAIARYAGLTGSPDESGRKRREKGLARSGNARVRRGMIQLAWRFLLHQKNSALTKWFRSRTENARGTRKPMIVALARKLLIALWRLMREGIVPDGVVLRPAQ